MGLRAEHTRRLDILQFLRDSSRVILSNKRGVPHLKKQILMLIIVLVVLLCEGAVCFALLNNIDTVRDNIIKISDVVIDHTK